MGPQGYEKICKELERSGISAEVSPVPKEGEPVEYLTVTTPKSLPPERVLNALMEKFPDKKKELKGGHDDMPWLKPLGIQRGSITFQDRNTEYEAPDFS